MKPVHIGYIKCLKVLKLTKIHDVNIKFWKQLTKIQRKRVIDFIDVNIVILKDENSMNHVEVNEDILDTIITRDTAGLSITFSDRYNLIVLGELIDATAHDETYECLDCGEPFECSIERHITEDHYETLLRDD